jgi:hypothetical protein
MSCSQKGMDMTGDGRIDYQYEAFQGVFNMAINGGDTTIKIITKTTGRYLGACS